MMDHIWLSCLYETRATEHGTREFKSFAKRIPRPPQSRAFSLSPAARTASANPTTAPSGDGIAWPGSAANGSPRQWYSQTIEREGAQSVPALGPYPSRGDYEHCFTLETPRGEFVQLTITIAEQFARAIECSRGARVKLTRAQSRANLYEREARDDRAYSDWAYDLLDDAVPAFHHQPFVSVT
jgi:hypothetical protein